MALVGFVACCAALVTMLIFAGFNLARPLVHVARTEIEP